jgi:hypothetical protein
MKIQELQQALMDLKEDLNKADEKPKMGHSSFTNEHANHVATLKDHGAAKAYAHNVVETSTANPKNKAKMKMMIDKSKSPAHLSQGMYNHILAHPSEGLKVMKWDDLDKGVNQSYAPMQQNSMNKMGGSDSMAMSEVVKADKNGQWSLNKSVDYSGPAARALAAKHPMPAAPKDFSGPTARALAAKHPMPSAAPAPGAHAIKQNSLLDARRGNALKAEDEMDKVDPEENVNIPHPKGKAKMADGVNKGEGTNEKAGAGKPHNKGKFKVMDEVKEKESKKEKVKGKPYNGGDDMDKGEKQGDPAKIRPRRANDDSAFEDDADRSTQFDENKGKGSVGPA